MATAATFQTTHPAHKAIAPDLRSILLLLVSAALPLGLFGLVNFGAESLGILPLFFAPFGLPGWAGAISHLGQLSLLGAAYWALVRHGQRNSARPWLLATLAAYIALPFITPPLDSLQLGLLCSGLFLLALATLMRVGRASPLAAWLMTPMLAILGFSAILGLALAAAYSPPFALMQGNQPATSAS